MPTKAIYILDCGGKSVVAQWDSNGRLQHAVDLRTIPDIVAAAKAKGFEVEEDVAVLGPKAIADFVVALGSDWIPMAKVLVPVAE